MDKKDQKILAELIINSRITVNKLAKKIGVSREVANYRINSLIKNGVIKEFYTIINEDVLGFSRFGCFFQLKGVSQESEKQFIEYLKNNKFVTYVSPIIGKWNIVFDILAKDKWHLNSLIQEILEIIKDSLEAYIVINTSAEQETFPTKLIGINKDTDYNNKTLKNTKLDRIDYNILKLISSNSRIEYTEISSKLDLTPNAIKHRIENLENYGIIKGYTISIDIKKLGYEWYNLQLKVNPNKKEEQLKQYLRQNSKVIYFYKYLGHENWDFDVGIIIKDSFDLREFIMDLRKNFGDIIKIHDLYVIVEESKPNHAPEGLFEP